MALHACVRRRSRLQYWRVFDPTLLFRYDPTVDLRYALMLGDPFYSGNKEDTVRVTPSHICPRQQVIQPRCWPTHTP